MRRQFYPVEGLAAFERFMGSLDASERAIARAAPQLAGPGWFTHEEAPCAGQVFTVTTSGGHTLDAVRLVDHEAVVGLWQRRHASASRMAGTFLGVAVGALLMFAWAVLR